MNQNQNQNQNHAPNQENFIRKQQIIEDQREKYGNPAILNQYQNTVMHHNNMDNNNNNMNKMRMKMMTMIMKIQIIKKNVVVEKRIKIK